MITGLQFTIIRFRQVDYISRNAPGEAFTFVRTAVDIGALRNTLTTDPQVVQWYQWVQQEPSNSNKRSMCGGANGCNGS